LGVVAWLSGRKNQTINLALHRASPCLFQLGEHFGEQFVLRSQQKLDRAEPRTMSCSTLSI
jgi:hypothetical protein